MKVKTFILTFLMMMSSPFLFGQHWEDPGNTGYQNTMNILAQINLDDVLQEGEFEVAAFYGDKLLGVSKTTNVNETPYHVHLMVQGDNSLQGINFRFYNGEKEFVSSTEINFTTDSQGSHSNYFKIDFYSVAQIEGTEFDVVYPSLKEAFAAATDGQTITLLDNITLSEIFVIAKSITLDGNGKTLTSSAGRAINVSGADGVTIKNLTINASGERAINVIQNATNVTIDNVTATAANYTVNVAASAPAAVVAIKNSTLNGLCTVNVAAAEANVTVDNSTVNCNDNNTTVGEAYAALSLNKDAVGGSIVATNSTINVTDGSDSMKGRNSAENGTVSINGSTDGVTVMVAVITYEGSPNYYSFATLAAAVEYAKTDDVVTLIRDITASDIITINKSITLDGNGKKLTSTAGRAINVSGADGVTIKNLTINASGERAINVIQNATNVTIDNVTATAANYTVNLAGSAANAVVAVKNSDLTGLNVVNVAAAGAQVTVDKTVLNCDDNSDDEKYAALALNKDAQGGSIIATEVTFNIAGDSRKATNQAENGTVTIDGSTEGVEVQVAYISYGNTWYGFATIEAAIAKANDGETIEIIRDITSADKITVTKSITINGNGKTLTYTGNGAAARAIDVPSTDGVELDVTIKNLTVDCNASYCQRGINYNEDGKLTLEGVTVKGTNVTYALNLPGSSDNCEVAINNSSLTGNIALNVWGANAIINATDSHFTSVDNATHENYAAVKLNNNGTDSAEGAVITITGGSITAKDENGEPSFATTNATATGEINISVTTQVTGNIGTTVAIVIYEGASEFYGCSTLQDAIDKAGDDNRATVKLLRNVETSELIKVEKAVVIDLNGKTVTANCKKAFEVYANATIKNGKIWSQQRCVDTRKNVELTLADVTLEAPTYYSTHKNQQPLTVGGSDDGTKVTMTNVNINAGTTGYAIISFVKTNLTATNSNFSGYSALYVKEGSEESEFKFEGSTLKGDLGSNDVEDNSFATIATEAVDVTVTLDANSKLEAVGNNQFAMVLRAEENNITVAGDITAPNFLSGNVNNNTIKVKAEYADELLAEGYVTSEADANDLVQVSGLAVAKIGETYYKTLQDAFNAAQSGETIQLLADNNENISVGTENLKPYGKTVIVEGNDFEVTGSWKFGRDDNNADNAEITINNVNFKNNGIVVDEFKNVTITNCTFTDITSELAAIRVICDNITEMVTLTGNTIENVSYDNGSGIRVRSAKAATISDNVITNVNFNSILLEGTTNGEVKIENNVLKNWAYANGNAADDGRAIRIAKGEGTLTIANNAMIIDYIAPEEFVKVSGTTSDVSIDANYWNAEEPNAPTHFNAEIGVKSYYAAFDEETKELSDLRLINFVAAIGDNKYQTLTDAITAAQPGNTIVLLAEITEDVTVNKNLTIDGKAEGATANSKYTGKMTVNASLNINIRNIDFVKGYIDELGGEHGYFTIVDCNFDGVDKSIGYAVTVRGGDKLTIENSTAKNYDYGMVYVPSAVANIAIKDVEVSNVIAAFNISYSGDGTFENVEVNDVTYGLHVQNYGARTFTLNDCVMNNVDYPTYIQQKSTAKVTFEFNNVLGYKETINSGSNQAKYGKYVLTSTAAKLTNVADDFNVTVSENLADNGYVVEYNEGVYSVVAGNVLNSTTGKKYATIQDAIDAAVDNDVIVVLKDVDLSTNECVLLDNSYNTYFKVEGKTVTVDLKGKTISGEYASSPMLVGVFSTDNNGHLTLEDSSDEKTGAVNVTTAEGYTVYSLIANYEPGCSITINGGTYTLDKAKDSHMYTGCNEGIIVNGGTFQLGNSGTGSNGQPWMFNAKGQNTAHVIVNGGTFNTDILHQYYPFEVMAQKEKALKYDAVEELWTMVDAVAYVDEQHKSGNWYTNEVGFVTLEEAFAAAAKYNRDDTYVTTVTLLANVELENTITVNAGKDVILDLNGKTISGVCNSGQGHMFMVQNTADLTVKDSSENKEGKITYARGTSNTGWVIDLEGDLILESGTIELTGDSWSIGYAVDVRPNSWGSEYTEATTFTMKGGKLVSSDAAVRVASSSADDHENVSANFIMNGGEIEAKWDGIFVQQSNAAYDILNVRINGGNIKSELSPLRLYGPVATSVLNNVENPITLNITGGTFDYTGNDLGNEKWLVRGVIMVSGGATFDQMLDYTDFEITGGTFEGDVNAYCAEGFAAVNNGDGTWTVMPVQEQSLVAGWNWYSSYLDITKEDLLDALGTNGKSIVQNSTWSATYYGVHGGTDYGWGYEESYTFDVSKMYMIETSQTCELALSGNLVDASEITITLNPGWNWIGYPSNVEVKLEDALRNLTPNEGDIIKNKTNSFAEYYGSKWLDGTATGMIMEPTKGYMYHNSTNETKTFRYNIVPIRGNNERLADNHYVVDYTKYPFNMTMTAVVDGAIGDNYEVAALVNGEVRGSARPVYVEALDTYMLFLTISGDEVEEVSFKYYDITTEEEYELVNRINYSNNAMVGSVNEPYVLSRGTTGIGEASMSEVNVYPNPTTTGTEINLEATCDKVEVFNALGVKVAEYQNVDTIDALETAGIYVIRITNNGNVQNCRLVVK